MGDVEIAMGESSEEDVTLKTGGQSSDQDSELAFEEITGDLQSDQTEIVLTLEEVSLPDDDDMIAEEISMDYQEAGISVQRNLVEAVHSQPDFGAPMVFEGTMPTVKSEPVGMTEVTLELETEDIEDDDVMITVEQDLYEAVFTIPEIDAPKETRPVADVTLEVRPV